MPITKNIRKDKILTNLSVRFSNPDYIADSIFPILPVNDKSGVYFRYDRANQRNDVSDLQTGRSEAAEVDYDLTQESYGPLLKHSLKKFINEEELELSETPLAPQTDATMFLADKMAIRKEKLLADFLADTANVTQNTTLSGTDQWDDYANSDPFDDIQTGIDEVKKQSGFMPNIMHMGYEVWAKLKNHPDLLERVKYTNVAVLTKELFIGLFPEIKELVIGAAVVNTAKESQTASMSFIWGKHCWVSYRTPTAALRTPTAGYTLELEGSTQVTRWTQEDPEGEFVKNTKRYEHKLVAVEAIYLIKNAIA